MDFPLEVVISPVVGCFFEAMTRWRGFLRMCLVEEKSECETQLSRKAPVCGGDFSPRAIEWSILTTGKGRVEWGLQM